MLKKYLILLLFVFGYISSSVADDPCDNLQITELSSNQILLFGVEIGFKELSEAIEKIAPKNGNIFYYREEKSKESTPTSRKIIELAIKNQVSITMSEEANFSDVVYHYGNAKPR